MAKRGRKSSAELSVVQIDCRARRPEPPENLTETQATIWREIIKDLPGDWITVAQEPLFAAYCRHVDTGDLLSKWINELDFATVDRAKLSRLLGMRNRETGAGNIPGNQDAPDAAESHARSYRWSRRVVAQSPMGATQAVG